jgi:hypothetical protein
LLRDLDQLLLTRGLRLNSGKTQILSARQAHKFFHESENAYLNLEITRIEKHKKSPKRLDQIAVRLRKRFDAFVAIPPYGHWDKIAKRYLTLFARLRDAHAVSFCVKSLSTEPTIRDAIWRYFEILGSGPIKLLAGGERA